MSLLAFFADELAPSRRRIEEAARTATKSALTTGLAASMQILGPFGPLFAFRIGQPGISLGLFEGAVTISCAAAMQAAIVPITGELLDYPGLIMAFLFSVFAAIAYLLSNTRLFLPLALMAVGTITTVYVGVFEPGQIGWGATYTFDGILVATLAMVAIDTYVWPSPPEQRLLESIAADFARSRDRLATVVGHYLDPSSAPLPAAQIKSRLAPNLALLKPVEEHMKPAPQRLAALLDAVMTAERAYLEVERLAVLADESEAGEITQIYRNQIEHTAAVLDPAFAEVIDYIIAGLPEVDNSAPWISDLAATARPLGELSAESQPASDDSAAASLNLLGFAGGLETIANLLEPQAHSQAIPGAEEADDPERHPFINQARLRFGVKLGATITLGLLVGLTTQRADIQTILWSIAVAGQPNQYGAVIRKTMLRLAGCIMGGLLALAAMLLVSENFDSLPPYVATIFAVTMFATYVAESSEWLGYAGIQTGITFLICYVGLAPTTDVYKPLWRFWGIVLGVLTTGFVFLVLWPEYASDKVIESLASLMQRTLALAKQVAEGSISEGRIAAAERHLSTNLLEALDMADQARLEGRRGRANAAATIEAAAIVIRIAYRFRAIALVRLAGSELALPQDVRERNAALEQGYCAALEAQLARLASLGASEYAALPSSESSQPINRDLDSGKLANRGVLESQNWSAQKEAAAQLEAYRRLGILLAKLDIALSRIASGSAAHRLIGVEPVPTL